MPRLAISPEFPRELRALDEPVRRDVVVAVRRFLYQVPAAPTPSGCATPATRGWRRCA
ncbi:hypothetical protein [Thermocatellispora tengchongensis]|uniref:hypothetical protein n=1 Tax=Thermocatellispora tengchongensis TaxID=1073253 RepID=UPI0036452B1D